MEPEVETERETEDLEDEDNLENEPEEQADKLVNQMENGTHC